MKQKLYAAGILLLLLFLLHCPQEALNAARDGMALWLNTLIPTLLPFLILTGFLLRTDGIERLLSPLSGLWRICLGLSPAGAYACLLGKFCGFPMGAKIASDLYLHRKLSRREAEYLLTFAGNASPTFLITYLGHVCLGGRMPVLRILGTLFLSDAVCMLFFRFAVYRNRTAEACPPSSQMKETSSASSPGAILDVSIMNGFETITRLGGHIFLFSLLSACITHYWKTESLSRCIVLGILELTTGLHGIAQSHLSFRLRYLLSMGITAFGGLCVLAQTKSVIREQLSILPYIAAKCLNAAVTVCLILFFVHVA